MKQYECDVSVLEDLRLNFGMEFFHRIEEDKLIIKPCNDFIFKRMCELVGKNKFKRIL